MMKNAGFGLPSAGVASACRGFAFKKPKNPHRILMPKTVYEYTGVAQIIDATQYISPLLIKCWGARGGQSSWSAIRPSYGGFSKGQLVLSRIRQLIIIVGKLGSAISFCGSGPTSGGLSGVFAEAYAHANSLIIAGGGGGPGDWNAQSACRGGDGGGLTGENGAGTAAYRGAGGTQTAGGAGGAVSGFYSGGTGAALRGGYINYVGGGGGQGGGGYYGGGQGLMGPASAYTKYCGGGGSGYLHPSKIIYGHTQIGPDTDDPDYVEQTNGRIIIGSPDPGDPTKFYEG